MNIVFMSMDTLPSTLWARDLYDQIQLMDIQNIPFKCPHKLILLFLIFSTITIEKSQMHSSEFGGYTSSSCVF